MQVAEAGNALQQLGGTVEERAKKDTNEVLIKQLLRVATAAKESVESLASESRETYGVTILSSLLQDGKVVFVICIFASFNAVQ